MNTQDYTPSHAVLEFCRVPRTAAEVEAHFDGDRRYRCAIYNMVKAGKLVNLNADIGSTRRGGLFVVAEPAARADVMQEAGLSFAAMAAFWGRETC